jgi:asparagine synthase (glutamine-hydrolysing)
MFAFAIADFSKNEVFLARDPFGIKPLLYRVQKNSFVFASEFQAFRTLSDWTNEIDMMSIDTYLRYQYIPAPNTVFRKVFKLKAGHCMTVRMGQSHQKIERYWQPEFSKKKRISNHDMISSLDDTLRDSVRRHLVSDVPYGALLSGGVDSSLVVGYMTEILDKPVKTFSIGFEDEQINELPYARQVAKKYGTEHHEEIVRFDALAILPELIKHHGEPFGDQSSIPSWYVSRLARNEVPMVLSGDGGDELFAGYKTYGNWLGKLALNRPREDESWKRHLRPLVKSVLPSRWPGNSEPENDPALWNDCVIRFNANQREKLWRPEYRFLSDQVCTSMNAEFGAGQFLSGVNKPQRADLGTFLPEDILCKVDVSSMRHGLEVRPPMLDKRVFEVCSSIYASHLFSFNPKTGVYSGKQPLKNLIASKMGGEFAFRPKQGFEIPLKRWLGTANGTQAIRDRLLGQGTGISEWFEPAQIEATIQKGNFFNIWSLVALEEWCSQFKNSAI